MTEVAALENRVNRLEAQIDAGFSRIETLLRSEINDLKTEQINDLREANKRLADDQRRLWEAVSTLQSREAQRYGGDRKLRGLSQLVSGGIGGLIAAVATWFSTRPPPIH